MRPGGRAGGVQLGPPRANRGRGDAIHRGVTEGRENEAVEHVPVERPGAGLQLAGGQPPVSVGPQVCPRRGPSTGALQVPALHVGGLCPRPNTFRRACDTRDI